MAATVGEALTQYKQSGQPYSDSWTGLEALLEDPQNASKNLETRVLVGAECSLPPSILSLTSCRHAQQSSTYKGWKRATELLSAGQVAVTTNDPGGDPNPAAITSTGAGGGAGGGAGATSDGVVANLEFSADDIMQGHIGDCWFLSAVSVVASHKDQMLQVRGDERVVLPFVMVGLVYDRRPFAPGLHRF